MTTQFGFTKMSIDEFDTWIKKLRVARTILYIQEHHTFIPDYKLFKGDNHFALQQGMKNHHVYNNGWADIAQQFTTFPDGTILTGRSMEKSPACISYNNANAVCIENLGNFDKGKDSMTAAQKDCIVRITAALCMKFNIPANTDKIVYHHWFSLSTGERNNGTANNKSCPGTNFFDGNKVKDCEANFLPQVKKAIGKVKTDVPLDDVVKYAVVTTTSLNIRKKPATGSAIVTDRKAATFGAVLRVYAEKNGWLKLSSSKEHWVYGKYTAAVKRAIVTADALNVRSGPGAIFSKVASFLKGQEVFIIKENNGWYKVAMDEKWVSKDYLSIT